VSAPALRVSPAWRLALWLLVVQRIGLELVALGSLRLEPIRETNGDWTDLWRRHVGWPGELLTVWQRWDALW
jgi:hypothetical protein